MYNYALMASTAAFGVRVPLNRAISETQGIGSLETLQGVAASDNWKLSVLCQKVKTNFSRQNVRRFDVFL
jgi:hypothetical protein